MSLSGKVAIVTGSSRGIGAVIAQEYAAEGANVVVNYHSSAAAAEEVTNSINATRKGATIAVQADVSTTAGGQKLIDAAISTYGKLDIIVLNAGVDTVIKLGEISEEAFDHEYNVNVKGPFFLVQNALPYLKEGGRVIFLSSLLTRYSAVMTDSILYVSSKGAVEQLSRVFAKELGSRGITVNTISPGPIDTEMFKNSQTQEVIDYVTKLHPAGRIGKPEEIASVAVFLASSKSTWVNGQNIHVNGGIDV